jgi:hypothetical protein
MQGDAFVHLKTIATGLLRKPPAFIEAGSLVEVTFDEAG